MDITHQTAGFSTNPSSASDADAHLKLWSAIRDFPLDDPEASLPFTERLARDHRWTPDFAADAVREYRRFLFLMALSERPLTPSDVVDEVWHLHLSYTKSYWEDLCGKVLGRPLHHHPTTGGPAAQAFFRECYQQTLTAYYASFAEFPPEHIWPNPDARFAIKEEYRTVRLSDVWIFSRLWSPKVSDRLAGVVPPIAGLLAYAAPLALGFGVGFVNFAAAFGGFFVSLAIASKLTTGKWGVSSGARNEGCGGCGGCGG